MPLDFEGVKARVSIITVAETLTTLNRSLQGPCPKCGGEDRFYLGPSKKAPVWFICSHCHQKAGDVIELVAWSEGISQAEACRKLGGDTGAPYRPSQAEPRKPDPKPSEPPAWADPSWQAKAQEQVAKAADRLTPESGAGIYLASRGLDPDTWRAFRLGAWLAKWPGSDERRPAVLLPHIDQAGNVSAIKYRAHDDQAKEKGRRFTQARGSQARLFGGHLLTGGGESKTLILLEGELNAAAVWQATRAESWDVLSIGAEKPRAELVEELAELVKARGYSRCLVWMDQKDRAKAIGGAISQAAGLSCLVGTFQSPEDELAALKWDAAELLKRGGGLYLSEVLAGIFRRIWPAKEQNPPNFAAVSPVEAQRPQNDQEGAEGQSDARKQNQTPKQGHSETGTPADPLPAVAGLIIGPPAPLPSAVPLTPAELATLRVEGQAPEAIRDALDTLYRSRRGSSIGAAILAGCQALEEGLDLYAAWLSEFIGEEG